MLLHLFRGVDIEHLRPMSFETLVGSILLPEVSTRLIMDDVTCLRANAIRILAESSDYGTRMFPSDHNDAQLNVALHRACKLLADAIQGSLIIKQEVIDLEIGLGALSPTQYNVVHKDGKEVIEIG